MRIFLDVQVGEEAQLLLVLDGRIGLKGDFDMVANTSYVNQHIGGVFVNQSSIEVVYHKLDLLDWASTTAIATILTISRMELPSCKT